MPATKMINRQSLVIVDGNDKLCSGPCYTFNCDNVGQSYIDHVIVSNIIALNIAHSQVLDDCIENTSDHLPVTLCIDIDDIPQPLVKQPKSKVAWHKLSKSDIADKYTKPLQQKLSLHFPNCQEQCGNNLSDCYAEAAIKLLVSDMLHTSDNLPQTKYHKALKPFWCKDLTKASKEEKHCWHLWKDAGKPRGVNNEIYIAYKDAKRRFRCAQRRAEREYEQRQMEQLVHASSVDQKFFWHLIGKHRKKQHKACHPIKQGDVTLTDPDEIRNQWKEYYKKLYTPMNLPQYDDNFKQEVEEAVDRLGEDSHK
jgi:hypothetical protein